ncbi:hypothetical protein [Halorussus caseinilyticus]|uniref:Uncharacterized protein n=1 Tax=Halorussus caseinilyticus TaxID=3034025 RepID=A0ABD5WPH1_9EURY
MGVQHGPGGDFESLVRELEPEVLAGLGYRDVDASDPGVEALSTRRTPTDVRLEGALKSAELDRLRYPDEMRAELTALANADDPDGDGTPTFGPPTYGKYHADVSEIPDSGSSWVRELNVDPRHRIAAGFGAEVVRDQQEQLLGSAWDQVGEIRAANRLLRRARLAREASNRAHDELTDLSPAEAVSATAGMHDRARWNEKATTFRRAIEDSKLPAATVSRELRRLLRPDGPIAGRIGDAAPDQSEIVDAFDPASEGTSPVRIEREGFPDGARLLTPEKRDGYEYGGFAELCEVVGGQSGPSSPGPVLHDEAKTDGDELREECWSALEDARGVVQKTREGVEDPRLRAILADLAAELAVVGREEGGEFDGSNNLLAGVDETVEDGDDATRVVAFLGAVARAFETVSDAADGVERLADDLSPDDAAVVRGNFGDYRAACRTFEVALAARAFRQLRAVCAVVVGVPDDLPADGTGVEDVRVACRAVCGESASSPGGLVADLKTLVGQSSHARATDVMAEIRRLVAVTGDRLAELRESGAPVESAVTSWRDVNAVFDLLAATMGHSGRNAVRSRVAETVCPPYDDEPSAGEPIDLGRAKAALLDATDPERAVPRRISRRLGGATGGREDPLDEILAAPTFDEPMYEPLADLSQDYLLPGVGDVPRDSIGVLETNPEFVRSYMVGLNHEMAREFRWREYPTDMRGTYFDRFWGAEGAVPVPDDPADIEAIHTWGVGSDPKRLDAPLARDEDGDESSDGVGGGEGNVVLLIRGELLRRYPNTTIYAVKAAPGEEGDDGDDQTQTGRVPDLPTGTNDEAPDPTADDVAFPMFRGHLDSDVTFFGFDLGVDEARGTPGSDDELGWFFVVEEAPGEPRLGLDVSDGDVGTVPDGIRTGDGSTGGGGSGGIDAESGWAALSWGHVVGGAGEDPSRSCATSTPKPRCPARPGGSQPRTPRNGARTARTWRRLRGRNRSASPSTPTTCSRQTRTEGPRDAARGRTRRTANSHDYTTDDSRDTTSPEAQQMSTDRQSRLAETRERLARVETEVRSGAAVLADLTDAVERSASDPEADAPQPSHVADRARATFEQFQLAEFDWLCAEMRVAFGTYNRAAFDAALADLRKPFADLAAATVERRLDAALDARWQVRDADPREAAAAVRDAFEADDRDAYEDAVDRLDDYPADRREAIEQYTAHLPRLFGTTYRDGAADGVAALEDAFETDDGEAFETELRGVESAFESDHDEAIGERAATLGSGLNDGPVSSAREQVAAFRADVSAAQSLADDLTYRLNADLSATVESYPDDATTALATLADPLQPVLMLPVQLETRFTPADSWGDCRLQIRVYPDDVHVDTHERGLTAAERAAGRRFWERVWWAAHDVPTSLLDAELGNVGESDLLDDVDLSSLPESADDRHEAVLRRAWNALVERFDENRAAWVKRATAPPQADDLLGGPIAPAHLDSVAFSALGDDVPTLPAAWTRPPRARLLPDRWVAVVDLGDEVRTVEERPFGNRSRSVRDPTRGPTRTARTPRVRPTGPWTSRRPSESAWPSKPNSPSRRPETESTPSSWSA